MTTYRNINGTIINDQTKSAACERLLSAYLKVAVEEGFEADFSDTHVGDFAFEHVVVAADIHDYAIKGWDAFYSAYRAATGSFPFVAMDNGLVYEHSEEDGDYILAFDPDTLGEHENDDDPAYPVFFKDASAAAGRYNAPAWLREVVIETPNGTFETGVFTRENYCTITLGTMEEE